MDTTAATPKISPVFFLARENNQLTYYINASAWHNGSREPLRSQCATSSNGHDVLALTIEPGRFNEMPRGKVMIEVAGLETPSRKDI